MSGDADDTWHFGDGNFWKVKVKLSLGRHVNVLLHPIKKPFSPKLGDGPHLDKPIGLNLLPKFLGQLDLSHLYFHYYSL